MEYLGNHQYFFLPPLSPSFSVVFFYFFFFSFLGNKISPFISRITRTMEAQYDTSQGDYKFMVAVIEGLNHLGYLNITMTQVFSFFFFFLFLLLFLNFFF